MLSKKKRIACNRLYIMEDIEILACADKITYESKVQAEGGAAVANWQHGVKLKAYLCRYCKLWHLASK